MADFGIDGFADIKENLSDSFDDIKRSARSMSEKIRDASDESSDAATAFGELAGVGGALDGSMESTEDSIEEVNDELQETTVTSQTTTASVAELNAALRSLDGTDVDIDGVDASDVSREGLEEFFGGGKGQFDVGELFGDRDRTESFISSLDEITGGLSDVDEVMARASIGDVLEGDTKRVREFAASLSEATSESVSMRDALASIRPLAREELDIETRRSFDIDQDRLQRMRESIGGAERRRVAIETERETDVALPEFDPSEFAATNAILERTEEQIEDVGDEASQTSISFQGLSSSSLLTMGNVEGLAFALSDVEDEAEEAADEIQQLSVIMASAAPALRSLSANIGPFNVGLTNLATTIPILIATLGPLIAVLGGLAVVLIGVVAALGALTAIGVIGFVQQLEDQFASVTETTEAFQAILEGLQKALWEAVAPLRNVEMAGLDGIDLFLRLIQNTIELVNMTSEVLAELLEMEEVADFFFRIEAALLGIGDATEGMTMMEAMRQATEQVLPVLTDLIMFLIDHTPDFIRFASTITDRIAPALSQFTLALMDLSTALSHVGADVLTIILPGIAAVIFSFTQLLEAIVAVERAMGPLGDAFSTMIVSSIALATVLGKLWGLFTSISSVMVFMANRGIAPAVAAIQVLNANFAGIVTAIGAATGGIILLVGGLIILEEEFGAVTLAIEMLGSAIDAVFGPIISFVAGLAEAVGVLDDLIGAAGLLSTLITGLTGVIMTVTGAWLLYQAALSGAIGLTALAGIQTSTLTGSLLALSSVAYGTAITALKALGGTILFAGNMAMVAARNIATYLIGSLTTLAGVIYSTVIGALSALAGSFLFLGNMAVMAIRGITTALVSSGWGAALLAAGAALAFIANRWGILEAVAVGVIGAITAALVSSGWGALLIVIAGALAWVAEQWSMLASVGVAAIGAITAALVSSGVGAIVVALGLLLSGLIVHWDDLTDAVKSFASAIGSTIGGAIDWLTDFDSRLQDVKNLLDEFLNPGDSLRSIFGWIMDVMGWMEKKIKDLQDLLSSGSGGFGGTDEEVDPSKDKGILETLADYTLPVSIDGSGSSGVGLTPSMMMIPPELIQSATNVFSGGGEGRSVDRRTVDRSSQTNITINMNGRNGELSAREQYRIRKAVDNAPDR
jgi:hypothetical protein